MSEVFSPPRVGKEAVAFGLDVGDAIHLTTGWDFNKDEDRVKAEERVETQKPLVLIGSPPCVAFSQLQTLIPDSERKRRQLAEGISCIRNMWMKDECSSMRTPLTQSRGRSRASGR